MRRALFLYLTGLLTASSLSAQTPPDAGALRQQIEQGRELPLPPSQPTKPADAKARPPASGLLVTVTAFRLNGNTQLATEELQLALSSYLNRPLD